MSFWKTIIRSFTDLSVYYELLHYPMRTTVRFAGFFLLMLICTLAASTMTISGLLTNNLLEMIPDDTTFTFKDMKLSSESLAIPLKYEAGTLGVITLDTDRVRLQKNQTEETVLYKDFFLEDDQQDALLIVMSKQQKKELILSILSATGMFTAVMFTLFVIFRFLFLQVHVWIVEACMKLLGYGMTREKLLQLAVHVELVAITITVLCLLLYRTLSTPLLELTWIGVMILALWDIRKRSTPLFPQQPSEQIGK
jgi:hypothetical protein